MTRLALLIATFGYVGYAPVAPGTCGSAAGLVLYALLRAFAVARVEWAVIAVIFLAGTWAGSLAERHFGTEDPGPVVIDEVLGMLVTLALLPTSWRVALLGFFVFRVFDIIKPWPASRLERLHGGFGIMADDGMAGVYANVVVRLAWWLAPGWLS